MCVTARRPSYSLQTTLIMARLRHLLPGAKLSNRTRWIWAKCWPMVAKCWPIVAKFGQHAADLDQRRPVWGKVWPMLRKRWPTSTNIECWSNLASIGHCLSKLAPTQKHLALRRGALRASHGTVNAESQEKARLRDDKISISTKVRLPSGHKAADTDSQ